jgi:glycosyltransferase involved in cell wall biosynthesis
MKVLLIATDLYRNTGGGQTVYRRIIESAPGIDFFYFRDDEPEKSPRPRNATAIALSVRLKLKALAAPPYPAYKRAHLQDADRFARSVKGQHFDIVDIPDFFAFGSLLKDAFAHHGTTVDRIVLAMHGNISVSLEMAWGSAGDNVLEQRLLERAQFEGADAAYAISPRYIREWQAMVNRPIHYIDPLAFIDLPQQIPHFHSTAKKTKPNLYCIGRTERRKGNDLFVELVRWLDPAAYAKAAHIGEEVVASWGVSTPAILHDIAKKRDATVEYLHSLNRQELKALFQEPSVVILPVRYDSLNLVALEALFEGCPVAVSSEAGVCEYLDSAHPGLPYIKIDFDNIYSAVASINELLHHYDERRARLRDYLCTAVPKGRRIPEFRALYGTILANPSTAVQPAVAPIPYYETGQTRLARAGRRLKDWLPNEKYRKTRRFARERREYFARKLRESEYFGDARFIAALVDSRHVPARLKRIAEHSEYSKSRLREKLNEIYGASTNSLYRCNFWLEIARIERILGNDLVAVTYELRALRLIGRDAFGILPRVLRTLESDAFALEAEAARALYDSRDGGAERVHAFLHHRYQKNLSKSASPYDLVLDRRRGAPRVAVIISLYKAAAKLRLFLTTMMQQTLAKRGEVEFVFVDSGSPDREYAVLEEFLAETPMNAVYARSPQRETIQSAWNRGILLSTAPYLAFLGVDETLYPDALETLAQELESNPSIDWVMSNSLVTAVDARGIYKNDVMPYDRRDGTKDHAYLETCYLSWVGGMYRRSIHERYGYYDESFAAAGDTEFKSRVLPHIAVRFVPRTLGLFLNYPDERTTASPRAEIEDLRAWYIHRTPGGVQYAFSTRSVEDVERLLAASLAYRKSYCSHLSTDIEYATYLSTYLGSRSAPGNSLSGPLSALLTDLRRMEYAPSLPTATQASIQMLSSWRRAMKFCRTRESTSATLTPAYKILNDNRFEQHSWLWKTT